MSLLSGMLFLTACGQASPAIQTAPIPVVGKATSTLSSTPTNTSTSVPIETPTATITPLPTIPTFTPTFDARTIVTVTPAPKAECLTTIPYPNTDFDLIELMKNGNYVNVEEAILWFLNKYDPQPLVEYAWNSWGGQKKILLFRTLPMMDYPN